MTTGSILKPAGKASEIRSDSVAGLRRSALVEATLYLGAAVLIDTLFFAGDRFWSVEPHPFWPIVILVSVQYGTREGLVATALAVGALFAGHVPERAITQDLYDYLLVVVQRPVMWFATAIVVGELRMRHVRERDRLRSELEDASRRAAELAEAYQRLIEVRDALEARVAGQVRTAVRMYQAARSMEKLDPSGVLLGVMDVVSSVLNPTKFSVYLLEGQTLEISIGLGWTSEETTSRTFTAESKLFQEVVGRQRVLCSVNREDEMILGKEGVLAGPLRDHESGGVLGMLKIEKMGFLDLHFSNVETFRVLCDWIADSYVNARRYEAARDTSVTNERTQLLTFTLFERQKNLLVAVARRVGFDVSMVLIRIENPEKLANAELRVVPVLIQEAVREYFRSTDLTFDYQKPGVQFCVLLPATKLAGAEIVGTRLRRALQEKLDARAPRTSLTITSQQIYRHDPVRVSN